MARGEAPEVHITEGLRPVGDVVDTYVRPAAPARSPLHEVAKALQGFDAELSSLADKQFAVEKKNAEEVGKSSYWLTHKEGAAEGTATGVIPFQNSPVFSQGNAEMEGRNHASNLGMTIGPEYQTLDKASPEATDPAYFDKWFRSYVDKNQPPENRRSNPYYLKAWTPGIQALHDQYQAQFIKDRSEAVKFSGQQNLDGSLGIEIDRGVLNNAGNPDLVDLGQKISTIRQNGKAIGLEKADVDKRVVDAITSKAIEYRNPKLLDLLDHDPAAPGGMAPGNVPTTDIPLGATDYGRDKKLSTAQTIKNLIIQDATHARTLQTQKDKDASDAAQASVVNRWLKNGPMADPTPEEMAAIQKTDPLFPTKLQELKTKIVNKDVLVDEGKQAAMADKIMAGGGMAAVLEGRLNGAYPRDQDVAKAVELVNTVEKYNQSGGAFRVTEDPAYKAIETQVQSMTKDPKWATSVFGATGVTAAGRAAINEARIDAMQWQIANPNASAIDRTIYLQKLQEAIINRLAKPDTATGDDAWAKIQYVAPQPGSTKFGLPVGDTLAPMEAPANGQGQAAPVSGQAPTQGSPEGAPQAPPPVKPFEYNNPAVNPQTGSTAPTPKPPKAPDWVTKLQTSPEPPKINDLGLSKEQRDYIEAKAAERGVDPQKYIDHLHKTMPKAKAPASEAPAKETPATGKRSDASPQQDRLQQFAEGLGLTDFANITPEHIAQVRGLIDQHAPGLFQRASYSPASANPEGGQTDTGGATVSARRVAQINASPHRSEIENVAKASGFDPEKLKAIVSIESSGRADASTGSYHGLLQLSDAEFRKYGNGGNIMDPKANLEAGVRSLQDKSQKFTRDFGREPSATELYLMHQQGEAGLRSHMQHLDQPAWQSMLQTGEGRQKGSGWARQAIWGNVPQDMRAQFGSVDNITSADFVAIWMHKLQDVPFAKAKQLVAEGKRGSSNKTEA